MGVQFWRAPVAAPLRAGLLAALAALWMLPAPARAAEAQAAPLAAAGPAAELSPAARIAAAHFAEPLVAMRATTPAEDGALAQALVAYDGRAAPDDFRALEGFVAAYPDSPWRVAVLTDLGVSYLHYGYFSKALAAWQEAWHDGKDAQGVRARALVDGALGELLQLTARLGHQERLAALLREVGNRPLSGPATEALKLARQTLWVARHDPRHLFNCGPAALRMLMLARGVALQQVDYLYWAKTGSEGTSLAEVAQLAAKSHLPYVMAFRKPGQAVPIPSVVHWKVGHFAAIVGERDGRYQIEDPSFGHQALWVTRKALDAEASGYFLAPAAAVGAAGWRVVDAQEAGGVWGKGDVAGQGGTGNGCGMCGYDINEYEIALELNDTPVGYAPPKGPPVRTTLSYNQWDSFQPSVFNFFNISSRWTLNWLGYVQDDPTAPGTNVLRYQSGGGEYAETGYDATTGAFAPEFTDDSVLELTSTSPITYKRLSPDGSVWVYAESDGSTSYPRNVFLTQMTDPQGNALTFNYTTNGSGQVLLTSITDATGRNTTFTYGDASYPLQITKITDPFGRSAALSYNSSGELVSDTDVLGITSSYAYDASGQVDSLTTPYGTTTFAFGGDVTQGSDAYGGNPTQSYLQITDPLGYSEREEALEPAPIPFSESQVPQGIIDPFNEYLNYRDSFHWDKHQYAIAGCSPSGGCNYSDARVTHFTHDSNNINLDWDMIESQKNPLENRVWYNYPGQPTNSGLGAGQSGTYNQPTAIARVLDNGTTQLTKYAYNNEGNVTQFVDPAGRRTNYTYAANGIDITSVSQLTASGNQITARYTYNSQHRPLTYTDAAGKTWTYTYNSAGQMTSQIDPLGEKTTYNYNNTGDLTSIVNANGKTQATYTYDAFDRVASYTDSEGWTVTFAYDAADRITSETFPDGTTRQFEYTKLDLTSYTDRQGRVWQYAYDADRRLTSVTDPLGHQTKFAYYEDNALKSLTDPDGHVTTWNVDLESRPTAKLYPDGSQLDYLYQNAISLLSKATDALGQTKDYAYTLDNRLSGISYLNPVNPTPNVSFAYDPYFPRLVSMTDGTGTTQYQYVPVGGLGALKLQQETGPLANSAISYTYDALGRLAARAVAGVPAAETFQYDTLNRLMRDADALGSFAFGYLDQTGQVTSRLLTGTQVSTTLSYLPNSGDRRLAGIDNRAGRLYGYTTTPEDLLTKATETVNSWPTGASQPGQNWTYSYDNDNRVLTGASTIEGNFSYGYDAADNITTADGPGGNDTGSYNSDDEIASFGGRAFTYDKDGDLLSDGQRTYQWDAENRLIGINYVGQAGMHTAFAYDGLDRRTSIAETPAGGGTATTTHYLWCGSRICQSRNASNQILKQYYDEGEVIPASSSRLYYGRDQLGSVRDALLINPDFDTVQTYDYDPYGNATKTPTTAPLADFRYAGMFYHATSGLYLTQYRAYDPHTGRWLSRDPAGDGGVGRSITRPTVIAWHPENLYRYADANPVSLIDLTGLYPVVQPGQGFGLTQPGQGVTLAPYGYTIVLDPGFNAQIYGPNGQLVGTVPPGQTINIPGVTNFTNSETNYLNWLLDNLPPGDWGNPDTGDGSLVTPGTINWLNPAAEDSPLFGPDPNDPTPVNPDPQGGGGGSCPTGDSGF